MRSLACCLFLVLLCPFCNAPADASTDADEDIVGGSQVPRGRWPDVVAVIGYSGYCTGTLIAPDVVLTAGHCIDSLPYEVVIDTIDYGRTGGERIRVSWARAYPSWEQRYDIGVLMLDQPATQAKPRVVATACTARALLQDNAPVKIVGFGLVTAEGLDDNTRLHEATVPITDKTCTLDPACNPAVAPHGEFMAGGHGADSCFGDSGGPVYIDTQDGHGHALVGVVSRGLALPQAPCGNGGVYVRVDKVISWIQSVTGRKLAKTQCGAPDADASDASSSSGGCSSTGSTVGILAALAMLVCAWILARRDRTVDVHDFDV
ncbi:MAG: serine protease [Myxococcota bacterium]|nr:serine protease [Myxococcota bacterium]